MTTTNKLTRILRLLSFIALAALVPSTVWAANLNVNFDAVPQTGLEGPAGGLSSAWNHILTSPVTATNLVDSAGMPSTMGLTCTADGLDEWPHAPQFSMLRSGTRNFGQATPNPYNLIINGLDTNKTYDLYIAGYYPNEDGCLGEYSTTNITAGPNSAVIDNGGPNGNDDTWVEGTNYVRFQALQPFVNGTIAITIVNSNTINQHRAMVSGFQLVDLNATPEAYMGSFGVSGMPAVIDHTSTNITWTVPYGTVLTTLAPEYTLSDGATCDIPSGSVMDFSSPVTYTVTSSDAGSIRAYVVTVIVTPISAAKDILSFGPGAVINGSLISWKVQFGTDVTMLSPVYSVSPFSTGDPVSGTVRDFTTPQTYTVTAEDLSTKTYVVIVSVSPAPWINVNVDPLLQTDLVGPAGGSGATWNSIYSNGTDIINALDYAGNPTPVRIVLPSMGVNHFVDAWPYPPELSMLRGASAQFGWNDQFLLYLYGLDTAKKYDLYIGSYYANENGSKGMFWTDNATSGSNTNYIDNGGYHANNDTYVEGSNFIRFADMVPDGSSNITIRIVGLGGCRAMLCGFQLVDLGQAPFVDITNIAGSIDVPFGTTNIVISGTNSGAVVDMWWYNTLGSGTLNPMPGSWNFSAPLSNGANVIVVGGSNALGVTSSEAVTVNVIPEPATAAVALFVIGVGHLLRSHSLLVRAKRRSDSLHI